MRVGVGVGVGAGAGVRVRVGVGVGVGVGHSRVEMYSTVLRYFATTRSSAFFKVVYDDGDVQTHKLLDKAFRCVEYGAE